MVQVLHTRPSAQTASSRFALWRLGFRPFYLLASVFAALSIGVWALQYAGWLEHAYLAGPLGHAHEMLFGFALAVVSGFLFTAVRNWTGRPTPTGPVLAAIAALWLAGRVLVLTPYGWAAAIVNVAFPLAVAAGIAVPIFRSRNRRNYFFVAVLAAIAIAVLAVHLAQLDVIALPGWIGIRAGLDIVLFVMSVMGGRVIAMFTNNAIPGTNARRHPLVEKLALGSVLVLLVADTLQLSGAALAAILAVAAVAHAVRLALWQPWRTLHTPIVWVLHAAYAWIVIHLVLRALSVYELVPAPLAVHALTIGAIGGLTIGMMTRTARGHTGRPLQADRWEVTCYALVLTAALVRVFGPLVLPAAYLATVELSAVLWSAGYALYAIRYWPILTRSRLDGASG
ncbi:MAG: NnrS family protein [Burkholderiales bacterium]|nr:NnrS family protein [Burkholderiales bacterium]